jgi:hypothetical protein
MSSIHRGNAQATTASPRSRRRSIAAEAVAARGRCALGRAAQGTTPAAAAHTCRRSPARSRKAAQIITPHRGVRVRESKPRRPPRAELHIAAQRVRRNLGARQMRAAKQCSGAEAASRAAWLPPRVSRLPQGERRSGIGAKNPGRIISQARRSEPADAGPQISLPPTDLHGSCSAPPSPASAQRRQCTPSHHGEIARPRSSRGSRATIVSCRGRYAPARGAKSISICASAARLWPSKTREVQDARRTAVDARGEAAASPSTQNPCRLIRPRRAADRVQTPPTA